MSLLLLLLRLMMGPAPVLPATAGGESAARPATAVAVVDPVALRGAQADLTTVEAGPRRIRGFLPAAGDRAVYTGCVAQRLAEAQVHVSMARDEMRRLTSASSSPADKAQARQRLAYLAQRTREVQHAAVSCVDEEDSSISAVRYQTLVPPAVERRRDASIPPPPIHPCPGINCLVIPEP